jgi:hypothetical protein
MPKKWTHLKFLTELVYDLIFPGQTAAHLSTIGELDDCSIDSTRSFSLFASVDEAQLEEEINLDCDFWPSSLFGKQSCHPHDKEYDGDKQTLAEAVCWTPTCITAVRISFVDISMMVT